MMQSLLTDLEAPGRTRSRCQLIPLLVRTPVQACRQRPSDCGKRQGASLLVSSYAPVVRTPPLRTSSKPKTSKGATSKHGRIEDEASTYEIWGNTNPLSLIAATLRSAFLSTDQQREEAGTRRSLGFPEHLLPPPLFSCLQGYWGGQSFPYLPR